MNGVKWNNSFSKSKNGWLLGICKSYLPYNGAGTKIINIVRCQLLQHVLKVAQHFWHERNSTNLLKIDLVSYVELEDNENLPRCASFDFVNDSDITCWKMGGKFEISDDLHMKMIVIYSS